MVDDAKDVREVLLNFLGGLPPTIKSNTLSFVALYAAGTDLSVDRTDREVIIRDLLLNEVFYKAFGGTLAVIAVLDHRMRDGTRRFERAKKVYDTLIEQFPDMEQYRAAIPLMQRHHQQAAQEWRRLRETELSALMLDVLEDNLLRPTP